MSRSQHPATADLQLPRPQTWLQNTSVAAPTFEGFTSRFGNAFPAPEYLKSDLGSTAVYSLRPQSSSSVRPVLMIHGVNTPALGLLPLAQALQRMDPSVHVVLFDLWGHGLSSTPIMPHTPHIFQAQVFQVLGYLGWSSAHVVGYSFGGSTAVGFAINNPWMCKSVTLLAPAGLLQHVNFSSQLQERLEAPVERELEAQECVMNWLEGGPLIVPEDWKKRTEDGEVVAEALRQWELDEHPGYPHSVLSMFRYGGVYKQESRFRAFAELPVNKLAIVGANDPVCSKQQLIELGLGNVEVIENKGHDFVRSAVEETGRVVTEFWREGSEAELL